MKKMYAIKWYEELDSTNNEAIRMADSLDNLSVIAASYQTAGRGQRGNSWQAAHGENLTFSVFLRFPLASAPDESANTGIPAADQFRLSETATLAQCRFLQGKGIDARIKWPNDIYVGNRKISGMLVENSLNGGNLSTSVVGIGMNVNQTAFPPELPNPVSMKLLTGKEYDIRALLEEFMDEFCASLELLELPADRLREIYESGMYRRGEKTWFADLSGRPAYLPANPFVQPLMTDISGENVRQGVFEGTVTGISGSGLLKVMLADGSVREFGFKEIAYIIPHDE